MSIGAFIGIRPSFRDQAHADAFLQAIEHALRLAGLPAYDEPPAAESARPIGVGRSELDHHDAAALVALARRAREEGHGQHLDVLTSNPYRAAFLPMELAAPLATEYVDPVAVHRAPVQVASALALRGELVALAPVLGIRLDQGYLSDNVAMLINEGESLGPDDIPLAWNEERAAWLMLYEGARVALKHRRALSLAG